MKRDDAGAGVFVLIERLAAQVEKLVEHQHAIINEVSRLKDRVRALEADLEMRSPMQ